MALASLTIANVPMILAGLGEEFGWRGYLWPKLLPLGVWPAFIIIGLVWWASHLPLGLLAPSSVKVSVPLSIFDGIIGAVFFGAVLGRLRYASCNIFPVALAHIAYNNASGGSTFCSMWTSMHSWCPGLLICSSSVRLDLAGRLESRLGSPRDVAAT